MRSNTDSLRPIAVSIATAAKLTSLSPWTIRYHIKSGRLPVARFGKRKIVPIQALDRFVQEAVVGQS